MHDSAHQIDDDFESSSLTSYDHGLEISPGSLLDSDSSEIISDCTDPLTMKTLLTEEKRANNGKKLCRQRSWQEIQLEMPKRLPRLRRHNSDNVLFSLSLECRSAVADYRCAQPIRENVEPNHLYYRGIYHSELLKSAMINGRLLKNIFTDGRSQSKQKYCELEIFSVKATVEPAHIARETSVMETDRSQARNRPISGHRQRNSVESDEDQDIGDRKQSPVSLGQIESLCQMYNNSTYDSVFGQYALETERATEEEPPLIASDLGEPTLTMMEKKLVMKKRPVIRRDTNLFLLAPPDFKIPPD